MPMTPELFLYTLKPIAMADGTDDCQGSNDGMDAPTGVALSSQQVARRNR